MSHPIKHMPITLIQKCKETSKICACCNQFEPMASGDGWCEMKNQQVRALSRCKKFEEREAKE